MNNHNAPYNGTHMKLLDIFLINYTVHCLLAQARFYHNPFRCEVYAVYIDVIAYKFFSISSNLRGESTAHRWFRPQSSSHAVFDSLYLY